MFIVGDINSQQQRSSSSWQGVVFFIHVDTHAIRAAVELFCNRKKTIKGSERNESPIVGLEIHMVVFIFQSGSC